MHWIVRAGEVVATAVHAYERGEVHLVALAATILAGEPVLTVHDRMMWVPEDRLLDYQLAPADIPIAQALMFIEFENTA